MSAQDPLNHCLVGANQQIHTIRRCEQVEKNGFTGVEVQKDAGDAGNAGINQISDIVTKLVSI